MWPTPCSLTKETGALRTLHQDARRLLIGSAALWDTGQQDSTRRARAALLNVLQRHEPGDRRTCILLLTNDTILNLRPPRCFLFLHPPLLNSHHLFSPLNAKPISSPYPVTPCGSRPSSALPQPWGPAELAFHKGFLSLCRVDVKFLSCPVVR